MKLHTLDEMEISNNFHDIKQGWWPLITGGNLRWK